MNIAHLIKQMHFWLFSFDYMFNNIKYSFSVADMREPKLVPKIAKEMKRFHQLEVPGSKEPQLWNDIFKFFERGPSSFFIFPWAVIVVGFVFSLILTLELHLSLWFLTTFEAPFNFVLLLFHFLWEKAYDIKYVH